jgi:hypothetical protein
MVDEALKSLDGRIEEIYDEDGRSSIPSSPQPIVGCRCGPASRRAAVFN